MVRGTMQKTVYLKKMHDYIINLQKQICSELSIIEKEASLDTSGKAAVQQSIKPVKKNTNFTSDKWKYKDGGGGLTRVLQNGVLFEKGGVNISSIHGKLPKRIAESFNKPYPTPFAACGLSVVIHPYSPKIPTVHMNIRYFETKDQDSWFGGVIDLTPYYPHEEDFIHFHSILRDAVERVIPNRYSVYKKQCDEYFYLKHRKEMRGIGGIFFDYLRGDNGQHLALVESVGNAFLRSYVPIILRRKQDSFSEQDKQFQLMRRGRYVEFNLVYDRGTLFGLQTGGRVESILMSLPLYTMNPYNFKTRYFSTHRKMTFYYKPKNWTC